jgi:hypothetical protein
MWSLLAATALAVSPIPSALPPKIAQDSDFRCLAVVAVVLDSAPTKTAEDFKTVAGLTSVFMYYLGRIDARYPELDFVAAFKLLEAEPSFQAQFASEAARCGDEAEMRSQSLQEMGRTLQDLPPHLPGKIG